jgi:hypothetical protein
MPYGPGGGVPGEEHVEPGGVGLLPGQLDGGDGVLGDVVRRAAMSDDLDARLGGAGGRVELLSVVRQGTEATARQICGSRS